MKTRIIYNAARNQYQPQYKTFMSGWQPFLHGEDEVWMYTKEEALKWCTEDRVVWSSTDMKCPNPRCMICKPDFI